MSTYNRSPQQKSKESGKGRLAELGPAWIGAIATLIIALTGAGFFAGRVSAPAKAAATPTLTVTKTVTASPVATAGGSANPTPTSGPAAASDNGTLLGSYSFQLTNGSSAPLGPTAPTQSQITAGGNYDLSLNGEIYVGANEKIVSLPNGSTPTYSACTTSTLFEGSPSVVQGTAFCILETAGRVAGVTIAAIGNDASYATFSVSVWTHVS